VFGWPGVGRLLLDSIFSRDYPMVQGLVLLFAVTYIVVNLLVDLLYAVVDPRVRYD
jgi:ABC-type dipeptide/oligopeptide/nickel transport system permease component